MSSYISSRLLKGAIIGLDPLNPLAGVVIFQYNPDKLTRTLQVQAAGGDGVTRVKRTTCRRIGSASATLTSAVSVLDQQPNLSAESHVAWSKAQFVLGRHKEAAENLQKALREKPNVSVDPKLRALITATPH